MRGRIPSGPESVRNLDGSDTARERLQVLLEVIAGRCRVMHACRQLGISEARYQQLRRDMLAAAVKALEPAPAGRPSRAPSPEQVQIDELNEQLRQKELELQAGRVREEIALVLPRVLQEPPAGEKKRPRRARPRRTRGRKKNTSGG